MMNQHAKLARKIVTTRPNKKTRRFRSEFGIPDIPEPIPTNKVMRMTAEYVPFMKHNRKVDYEKVAYTL